MLIVSRKAETEFLTVAEFYYKILCKHRTKINSARNQWLAHIGGRRVRNKKYSSVAIFLKWLKNTTDKFRRQHNWTSWPWKTWGERIILCEIVYWRKLPWGSRCNSLTAALSCYVLQINLHLMKRVSSLSQRKDKTCRCLTTGKSSHLKKVSVTKTKDSITCFSENSDHNRNSPRFLSLLFHCLLWGQNQITSFPFAQRKTKEILTSLRRLLGQLVTDLLLF